MEGTKFTLMVLGQMMEKHNNNKLVHLTVDFLFAMWYNKGTTREEYPHPM